MYVALAGGPQEGITRAVTIAITMGGMLLVDGIRLIDLTLIFNLISICSGFEFESKCGICGCWGATYVRKWECLYGE